MFGRKILGSIIAFVLSILSIIQAAVSEGILSEWYSILFLVALAIGLLGIMIYDIAECCKEKNKTYKFEVRSEEFYSFFSKWYDKTGKLAIICDDLDWIVLGNDDRIYNALKQKSASKELTLFLNKGIESEYAQELFSRGATLKKAKESLVAKYSFSCLAPMEQYSEIIVRNKSEETTGYVKFVEIVDEEKIIDLINTILEDK